MSLFQPILAALQARLEGYQSTNVGWVGTIYTPTPQVPFLSTQIAWNRRVLGAGADGLAEYRGSYLINVYEPTGEGLGPAVEKVDALLALYPRGETLVSGGAEVIISNGSAQNAMVGAVWVQIPVIISWFCFEKP